MTTLDIRWPLGYIFSIIGAILVGYGLLTEPRFGPASVINSAWGAILVMFGGVMLWLALRAKKGLARG